jgi:hypothetical protein
MNTLLVVKKRISLELAGNKQRTYVHNYVVIAPNFFPEKKKEIPRTHS